MKKLVVAAMAAVVVAMASGVSADPGWFPRDVLAYAEMRQPVMGWADEGLKKVIEQNMVEGDQFAKLVLEQYVRAFDDLDRIEACLIDVKADRDLPVRYGAVLHYRQDKTLDWFVRLLFSKGPDGNAEEFEATMAKLMEAKTEYGGYEMLPIEGAPLAFAVRGSKIILASGVSDIKDMVDRVNGEEPIEETLSANPRFSRWETGTQSGVHMLRAFGDGVGLNKLIDQAVGDGSRMGREERALLNTGHWLEWRKASVVSMTVANDGRFTSRLELIFAQDPAWAPIARGGDHAGLKYIHPKAVAVASFSAGDIKSAMDLASDILRKAEDEYGIAGSGTAEPMPSKERASGDPGRPMPRNDWDAPRDVFGQRGETADRMLREFTDVIDFGWQTAARRFATTTSDLPMEISASDLAEATGFGWISQPILGFRPVEIVIGEIDEKTKRHTGAVKYQHTDGSTFVLDLSRSANIFVVDTEAQSGVLPIDPATGEAMSRSEYARHRQEVGRRVTTVDIMLQSRTLCAMMFGTTEADLLATVGENFIIGAANDEVGTLIGGRSWVRSGTFAIIPIRDAKRAERLINTFIESPLARKEFLRGRNEPVTPESVWNVSIPGVRIHVPNSTYQPAIAFTNDAIIFADPGIMAGILEGSRRAGAGTWHGLSTAKGAVVGYANPRHSSDLSFIERSKAIQWLREGDAPELAMNFAARYESGRVVVEFAFEQAVDFGQMVQARGGIFSYGSDGEMRAIESVHRACNVILDREEAKTGTRPSGFPGWDAGAALVIEENPHAKASADRGRGMRGRDYPVERKVEERPIGGSSSKPAKVDDGSRNAPPKPPARALPPYYGLPVDGDSQIFKDKPLKDAWRLIRSTPIDEKIFRSDATLGSMCRVLAVSNDKVMERHVVVVQYTQPQGYSSQNYDSKIDYFLVTSDVLAKIFETSRTDGNIPGTLVDRAQYLKLNDLEAAMYLSTHWKSELANECGFLINRRDQWKFQGGDTLQSFGNGIFHRLAEKAPADGKSSASGSSGTTTSEEERVGEHRPADRIGPTKPRDGEPSVDDSSDDDGPSSEDDTTPQKQRVAVVRIEGYGHWATLDRNGNILSSSWQENLAKLANAGR